MADIVDRKTRSRMMAGIRGADTRPEIAVRSFLHRRGFRFRLRARELPGRPDIVLPKYGAVVFVHGCFWHRHPNCRFAYVPKTRRAFWLDKFAENVERDRAVARRLRDLEWRVFVVWECEITEARLLRMCEKIRSTVSSPREPDRMARRRLVRHAMAYASEQTIGILDHAVNEASAGNYLADLPGSGGDGRSSCRQSAKPARALRGQGRRRPTRE